MHIAIRNQKPALIRHLIAKGVNLGIEPDTIEGEKNYRMTPFIITAAIHGDVETFEEIVNQGGDVKAKGFIGLSKKRKNKINSNIVGAAAYHGNTKLINFFINKLSNKDMEHVSKET